MPSPAMAGGYKSSQYGGVELKANYQKYWTIGLCIAIGVEMFKICRSLGFQLIVYGNEVRFLAEASAVASKSGRDLLK